MIANFTHTMSVVLNSSHRIAHCSRHRWVWWQFATLDHERSKLFDDCTCKLYLYMSILASLTEIHGLRLDVSIYNVHHPQVALHCAQYLYSFVHTINHCPVSGESPELHLEWNLWCIPWIRPERTVDLRIICKAPSWCWCYFCRLHC